MTSYLLQLTDFHAAMKACAAHALSTVRFTPDDSMLISAAGQSTAALATVQILERDGDDAAIFDFPAADVARVLSVFKLPKKELRYAARIRIRPIDAEPDIDGDAKDPGALEFVEEWNEIFVEKHGETTPKTLVMPRAFVSQSDVRGIIKATLHLGPLPEPVDAFLDSGDVGALATASKAFAYLPALRVLESWKGRMVVLATLGESFVSVYSTDPAIESEETKLTKPARARELWRLMLGAEMPADVDELLAWSKPKAVDEGVGGGEAMPGQGELPLDEADDDDDDEQTEWWDR